MRGRVASLSVLAGSTVRNELDPPRVLLRRALEDREVSRNPTERLRPTAVSTKPAAVGGIERVAERLDALPDSERAAWATAFYAGLRVGELRALRWDRVHFDSGVIRAEAG